MTATSLPHETKPECMFGLSAPVREPCVTEDSTELESLPARVSHALVDLTLEVFLEAVEEDEGIASCAFLADARIKASFLVEIALFLSASNLGLVFFVPFLRLLEEAATEGASESDCRLTDLASVSASVSSLEDRFDPFPIPVPSSRHHDGVVTRSGLARHHILRQKV